MELSYNFILRHHQDRQKNGLLSQITDRPTEHELHCTKVNQQWTVSGINYPGVRYQVTYLL